MIDGGYEFGERFQRRLLSLLVRHPEKVLGIIEPQYFTSPILVDIARETQDAYKTHPEDRLTVTSLSEVVKASLSRKARQNWPLYKKEIKRVWDTKFPDMSFLIENAAEFAKEQRYRQALVMAEGYVSTHSYDGVHKVIEKARLSASEHAQSREKTIELPLFHFHRLLATDFDTDRDYLVETIIPHGGAILSYGLPKGLKSWFSTAVALDAAIGDGKAVGYFNVPRPVRVLLVQVEDSAGRTKSRLQRLKEARPLRQNPHPGNLQIITRCPLNLTDPQWIAKLEAVIAKQKTELVIFDVFRRLFRGNVNSPEDTAAFLEVVDGLRDKYGVAAWIVHHSNKKSETEMMTKALGSINLTAWGEVLLYFKNKQESDGITTCNLEMETKDQAIDGELKVILDDEGWPMLRVEKAKPTEDKLHKAMSHLKNKWTVDDLAEVIGLKYAGAYKILQDWLKAGIAIVVSPGARGHRARYQFEQITAK